MPDESLPRLLELGPCLGVRANGGVRVHRALLSDGRVVAVKWCDAERTAAMARLAHEAEILQKLDGVQGVVRVIPTREHTAATLVLEYLDGPDLDDWLLQAVPGRDSVRLRSMLRRIGECLRSIHTHGVAHRDLSPTNVAVAADGRVTLLDWEYAAWVGQHDAWPAAGTPGYAAPELVAFPRSSDPALDRFSYGRLLARAAESLPKAERAGVEAIAATLTHRDPTRRPPLDDALLAEVAGDWAQTHK